MQTIARKVRSVWGQRGIAGLAVPLALLVAPAAFAQEPAPTPEARCADGRPPKDPEAARVAFRAGQTAFSEGAYARAVELWELAYHDDCTAHALLLNLAMAQELLERPRDAIATLKQFDSRSPGSPYVEANVKRIQRLEHDAAEKERERARRERAALQPTERPARQDDGPELSLPLALSVTGGVVAVVGGVLFLEGRSAASSAEERCSVSRTDCDDVNGVVDGERGRARAQVGGWMAGAGLVTAAGGLVWHFLAQPSRPLDQPATARGLGLSTEVGSARLHWSGEF